MSYGNNSTFTEKAAAGTIATLGVVCLAFVLGFLGLLYGILVTGFVGMKLWAWFVVPIFGLPTLSIVQAWGIALLIGLWTHQLHATTNKDEREPSQKYATAIMAILSPWIILFFGWIGKVLFL